MLVTMIRPIYNYNVDFLLVYTLRDSWYFKMVGEAVVWVQSNMKIDNEQRSRSWPTFEFQVAFVVSLTCTSIIVIKDICICVITFIEGIRINLLTCMQKIYEFDPHNNIWLIIVLSFLCSHNCIGKCTKSYLKSYDPFKILK